MDKKRISFTLAALFLLFLAMFGVYSSLNAGGGFEPENEVSEMNEKYSRVFVSGNGYTLDKKTRQQQTKHEKKRNRILSREESEDREAIRRRSGSSTNRDGTPGKNRKPGNGGDPEDPGGDDPGDRKPQEQQTKDPEKQDPDPDPEEEEDPTEKKKRPVIKTNLIDYQTRGSNFKFWVSCFDHTGRNIPVFSNGEGHFEVYVNGSRLRSRGTDAQGHTTFAPDWKDGQKNSVVITAFDRKNVKKTKRLTIRIKGKEAPIGAVSVTVAAPSLGLGTLGGPVDVQISDGDSVYDVLKDAFPKMGLKYEMPQREGQGAYLYGISRNGLAKDAVISDEMRQRLRAARITIKDEDNWPVNRLYEKDFTKASGWVYTVNGVSPGVGLSGYTPHDNDEIRLEFILMS